MNQAHQVFESFWMNALTFHIHFNWFFYIFVPAFLAVGNHMRGGWLNNYIPWGTQTARICAWGIPSAISAFLCGVPAFPAFLFGFALWAGSTLPLYDAMLGFTTTIPLSKNFAKLGLTSSRFFMEFGAGIVPLWIFLGWHWSYLAFLIAGILVSPFYWLGDLVPIWLNKYVVKHYEFTEQVIAYGEFAGGILFGIAILIATHHIW